MDDTEISPVVRDAIERLIQDQLGRFGVESVETLEADDHEGDPAIFVLIKYRDEHAKPDPKIASQLITRLNNLLFEHKERRFGYIAHKVPELARKL